MKFTPFIIAPSTLHKDFAQRSSDGIIGRIPVLHLGERENKVLIQASLRRSEHPPESSERMTRRDLFRCPEDSKERLEERVITRPDIARYHL